VEDEGLGGVSDPAVARAATDDGRLIITLDRGFGDIQLYPPGSHAGIVVLRVDEHSASAIADALAGLASLIDLDALGRCVAVYRDGEVRVR
jgi:predicted nuclease of predicted toxin-antitoxin system